MSLSEQSVLSGSCLCGAITYQVELPSRWCAHCHCELCRRSHGAAFVTWFGVPFTQFRLVTGEDCLRRFASSPEARRAFCRECGSSLFVQSERWPGEIHIALATVQGELDRLPQSHVYYDQHVSWFQIDDDLPKRGGPEGLDPLPE